MGKKLFGVLWAVLLVSVMVGRCYAATPEKKKIVLGVRADIIGMYEAIKPELDALGYEIEMKSFNDSIQPNQALAEDSIDVNWYQHEQYMRSYNEANKTNFVMIRPKTYGNLFAMYSMKWGTLDKLPEGALIGLCNDVTNQDRGLKMLQSQGLIKLNPSVAIATVHDIEENPRKFKFKEAEMQMLPQAINDLDAICLAAMHMVNAGKDPSAHIGKSDDESDYAVGFVVRDEDKDAKWAKAIANAAQCDALSVYLKEVKKGANIPLWQKN